MIIRRRPLYWIVFVAACVVQTALSCMQTGPTTSSGSNSGSSNSNSGSSGSSARSNAGPLNQYAGSSLSPSDYDNSYYNSKNGGPVKKNGDLDCNFDSNCCWDNAEPPVDELEWLQVNGSPDSSKFTSNFGTSTTPSGNFLALPVDAVARSGDKGEFRSCSIACTKRDVKVSLKHWETQGVSLKVCQRDALDSSKPLSNCKEISGNDPGPATVTLPAGKFFSVAVVASNFVNSAGSLAIIDNLKVDFTPCTNTTTTTRRTSTSRRPTTSQSAAPPVVPVTAECNAYACNFESGSSCKYSGSSTGGSSSNGLGVQSGRVGNRDTGVPGPAQGSQYWGSQVMPGQTVVAQTGGTPISDGKVMTMKYYEATDGLQLMACKNDQNNCEPISNSGVSNNDRQWQQGQIYLPPGTNKVLFVAENKGTNLGAIGLDDITLAKAQQPPSNTAGSNLC